MNAFCEALISETANLNIPAEHDLFARFIGEWDFKWIRGLNTPSERHEIGEWIFSRTLNGTAIQDVFIVPSRKENAINPKADAEIGTTIRLYNPENQSWDIFYGCTNELVRLNAVREDDKIVLTEITEKKMKWVFSEITADSFHWQHIKSADGGKTWYVHIDIFAKRRV